MRLNSILGRYLAKQIVVTFLLVLVTIMGIIMMFDAIEALRRISGREDVGMSYVFEYVITRLPQTVDKVLPFVMMVAAMITFWRVSKSNEYVIIRSAGVSVWGFLAPVLLSVFIVGAVNIAFVNPISSRMYELHETIKYRFATRNPKAMLFSSKGLWIREAAGEDKVLVIQAKSLRQEENEVLSMRDVSILEMNRSSQIVRRVEGLVGELEGNVLRLRGVKIYASGQPTKTLPSVEYETSIDLQRIKENFIDPDAISVWDLPDTIHFYESSGFSAQRHRMRYLSLLASPFLLVAMVLVAAIFSLKANMRQGGVMFMIVAGITTGFVVYFSSQVVYAFGINGYIPVWLAVWTPTLVVGLLGISVMLHLEEG